MSDKKQELKEFFKSAASRRSLSGELLKERKFGDFKGKIIIKDEFYDPLPDDIFEDVYADEK